MPVLRMASAIRRCRRRTDRGRCGIVPVTLAASLSSINPIGHRTTSVSRRKTRRTSAHFRARVFNPYPPRYRMAFASSDLPHPHTHRLALRRAFPKGDVRGSHVPLPESVGVGACCRPGGAWSTMPYVRDDMPTSGAFWLKPVNLFGLLPITTFITGSHMFTIPTT